MTTKLKLTVLCCLGFAIAHAQMGTLPPNYFMSNTNICDYTPWKLVFADNFDGNQVNSANWLTFGTWQNNPDPNTDNWHSARSGIEHSFIFRDYNVQVNNGSCKLLMRRETGTWKCASCPDQIVYRRHLSAGMLQTRRNLTNGTNISYNTGKFEARIKFPTFQGAWCAFWLWQGGGVNEIDMAEAWGGPAFLGSNQRRNTFSTHAWWLDGANNPNHMPEDAASGGKWPNQGWWNSVFNSNYHKQDDWHIYTTEWEDNHIKFFLDGALVNTMWKYVSHNIFSYDLMGYPIYVGSGCVPSPLTPYHIKFGYPYNPASSSALLLWGRLDHQINLSGLEVPLDSVLFPSVLGQMEIDYVRIWQRHPERDNHTDICDLGQPLPIVTGPNYLCYGNPTTFIVTNPVPNGTFTGWSYSPHFSPVGTSTNSSITLTSNSSTPNNNAWIGYNYTVPGCPYPQTKFKSVSCPFSIISPFEINMVRTINNNGTSKFQLFEGTYFPNYEDGPYQPTFEWDIDVVDGNDACLKPVHYKRFGQFVSTPFIDGMQSENYCINWKVKITDPQNNVIEKSGGRNFKTPLYRQSHDNSIVYFNASVTDPDAYENAVYNRVIRMSVSEDEFADSTVMRNMIEKIRTEELEPYLNLPKEGEAISQKFTIKKDGSNTKIYPNPTTGMVSIVADKNFVEAPIQITIYDLTGKIQLSHSFPNTVGKTINLNISQLVDALYIIEMKQGDIIERNKIVKIGIQK